MDTRTEPAATITTKKLNGAGVKPGPKSFVAFRNQTFLALLIGYGAYYLCRQNFSVAYAPLHQDLGVSAKAFGAISSISTAAYAVGKIITGAVADARGGRLIFLTGLFGSVAVSVVLAATVAIGSGAAGSLHLGLIGLAYFAALWSLNRFFQSMGWVGVVNVTSHWFRSNQYGTAMGAMSINYQFGGAVGALFAGFLLSIGFGWRALFFIPALLLLAIGLFVRRVIVNSPIDVGYEIPSVSANRPETDRDDSHLGFRSRFWLILRDPMFVVMCFLSVILTFLRECFTIWMPAYFLDMGARASTAAFKSAIFPLLGCAGTLVAGWFSDRYLEGRRAPVIAVLLVGLVLALLSLGKIEVLSASLGINRNALAFGLVGAAGFLLFGPYSLVGGVAALDFGGPRTSGTAIGLLDGAGHLGAVAAGYGVAAVVVTSGWEHAFQLMAIATSVGIFLTAFLWRVRPKP